MDTTAALTTGSDDDTHHALLTTSSVHGMLAFDDKTVIRRCYQRNNRKGGQKNLRCFPNCCSGVHATTGYCGGPVAVNLLQGGSSANVMLLAEFCPLIQGRASGSIGLDDTWPLTNVLQKSHKEKNPLAPLFVGSCLNDDDDDDGRPTSYCFNQTRKGWHYGFVSNKHVSEMHHVLAIYLMETLPGDGQHLRCVDVLQSPAFSIYCRRRAKTSRLGEILNTHPNTAAAMDNKMGHDDPNDVAGSRKRKMDPAAHVASIPDIEDRIKSTDVVRTSDTDWMILDSLLHEDDDEPQAMTDASSMTSTSDDDDDDDNNNQWTGRPKKAKTTFSSPLVGVFEPPPPFYSMGQTKAALGLGDVFTYKPRRDSASLRSPPFCRPVTIVKSMCTCTHDDVMNDDELHYGVVYSHSAPHMAKHHHHHHWHTPTFQYLAHSAPPLATKPLAVVPNEANGCDHPFYIQQHHGVIFGLEARDISPSCCHAPPPATSSVDTMMHQHGMLDAFNTHNLTTFLDELLLDETDGDVGLPLCASNAIATT
ncbi:Aste57867_11595 [Aphanomyces stellatus]|uniref:Aste57867_11595 protein n=1 Tax=Aphanomyces stellatus TaxID=120398 RepID=A0A485KTX0_9STRA|nr:hypothetical protein As57867_011552 [Aphanomyces stellatus]VFT88454.1 Aste57867_11595 [Aphanomyces stellatus]